MVLSAYGALADLYETLADVNYDEWAQYISGKISAHAAGRVGADVGCGSGAFTRRLKRMGYDVFGSDISPEMLARAMTLTREEGLDITYLNMDMRSFRSLKKLSFITACTDCVNYLDGRGMKRAFSSFSSALARGGLLAFDVSSAYKLQTVIADNLFGEDTEDYTYLWFNKPFDGGVEMDISLFIRGADGRYEKREEHHVQYVHTEAEIENALREAGFELISKEGYLGTPVAPDTQRIFFFAKKR